MIAIPVGIAAIIIGLRGFSARGIPITRRKYLRGRTAQIIGVACIAIGVGLIIYSVITLRAAVHDLDKTS